MVNDNGETAFSSTRSKRKAMGNGSSTAKENPREYIAGYVIRNILCHHDGWRVRERNTLGLYETVASRVNSDVEYVGPGEILDETYLSGLYDEEVVSKSEGKGFLQNAGILNEPYFIFSEELQREKKRRKHSGEGQAPSPNAANGKIRIIFSEELQREKKRCKHSSEGQAPSLHAANGNIRVNNNCPEAGSNDHLRVSTQVSQNCRSQEDTHPGM